MLKRTSFPAGRLSAAMDATAAAAEPVTALPRYDANNVQPFGVLLLLQEADLSVAQISLSCEQILSVPPAQLLGKPIADWLPERTVALLRTALKEAHDPACGAFYLRTSIRFNDRMFYAVLHRHAGQVVLELEPCLMATPELELEWLRRIERAQGMMRQSTEPQGLCQQMVQEIHALTGFSRVMVYRFDSEWNSVVFAEQKSEALESVRNLVFPAADISPAVREQYAAGQMRYIQDIEYQPTTLFPTRPPGMPPPDLLYATLRGATKRNMSYLHRLGVRSVLVVPVIACHRLWGLVVCMSMEPMHIPYALRRLCAMLAHTAGYLITDQLRAHEDAERQRLTQAARAVFNTVSEHKGHLEHAWPECGASLLGSLNAAGVLCWSAAGKYTHGIVPDGSAQDRLIDWLQQTELVAEHFFATDQLSALLPDWDAQAAQASGMIAIPLAARWQSGIAWLRPEHRHHVVWGHDPKRQINAVDMGRGEYPLSLSVEEMRGKAQPWSVPELESAELMAGLRAHASLKASEEALRYSEDRHRRLSAQTSDWYWEQDEEHRLVHSSNEVWAGFGFNQRAVIGLRRWEIGGVQYDPAVWNEHIDRLNRHVPFRDFEYAMRLPDGELHWASITGEPVFDKQGKFTGYLGTGTDITARKKAELAVAESEARFRLLADNAPVMIWLADEEGARTYLNQTWLNFTGLPLEPQVGYGWLQSVHPEDAVRIERTIQNAVHEPDLVQMEYRLRYHDGSYRWVESTAVPRFARDRSFLGFIGSVTDIHERKRLALELTALNQTLEERVQERTRELESFAYTISHDLRAPLRSIDGYAALLFQENQTTLNDQGQYYIERVRSGAQQMGTLIDALLRFSRYSLRPVERSLFEMERQVREVVAEIVPADRLDEVMIKSLPACNADESLIRQVWVNLISNALKFTRRVEYPRIEIGHNGEAYYVADNGAGFDMQYADKLFGVFNRLHSEEEYEGTGAGLAIVRRIVQRHEGQIWAQAQVGVGATFFFTLPAPVQTELL